MSSTQMPPAGPDYGLDDFRSLLARLPQADEDACRAVSERDARLTKPPGALARLEELALWVAGCQGRATPRLERARIAVFAGNHGVAAQGVSAFPAAVTAQMVANFRHGGAAINQLSRIQDAELQVYEMDLAHPTADFTGAPAMDEAACAQAMAYGMTSVDDGLDLLCLGEMGIGNSTAAAALCHGLFGGEAADWTGPGTGVSGAALDHKADIVRRAVALHGEQAEDSLDLMRRLGGRELAAIAGAILAAGMARTPVILDGYACCAAGAVLFALDPRALDHCVVGHLSAEPAHAALLERLGQVPLLNLGLRLGEGTGAALALGLVRAALACHNGMATFDEAGVSEKTGD